MRSLLANKVLSENFKTTVIPLQDSMSRVIIPSDDFLFSQCTIISSVMMEKGSHFICSEALDFVNDNGQSWSNESVKANYKSFIGAFNYVNHIQEPEKSVGFVADAALRVIPLNTDKGIYIYYVDILVATHRDHIKLIEGIVSGDICYLSMGCYSESTQCTKCGKILYEEYESCPCLDNSRGLFYIDRFGKKRIVAEMIGTEVPGSCVFIEASWLTECPAFGGASKRNIISVPKGHSVVLEFHKNALEREALKKYLGV